ncbi:ferritin-like domain-containing protein [Acidicapsa acidisoli]|uniref:ferritin-like domain-containing protein n=1 Tax=Acidicapsa acidisoli TaxID=1615681 RepID=UPI0021DFDCF0|nr:ferritin-like protein [Acidicapsa acidisoli]
MILLKKDLLQMLDGSIEGVRAALQHAVELEHATIPVYLYTLYSLGPGANQELAAIIRSVVIEEMLHMTIACNLLNAIGGAPVIDHPGFVPKYPGPLPGGVDAGLIVSLAPMSIEHVRNVFMGIEEPETPLRFKALAMEKDQPITIGMFYDQISRQLQESFFTGDVSRQVVAGWWPGRELFAITNLDQARRAIKIIVEQGEGTDLEPLDLEDDYAHYYRFAEIVHGRRLIKNPSATPDSPPEQRYIYGGAAVVFDPGQVQPLETNPGLQPYPAGSGAQIAVDAFNASYTNLLRCLHQVFNGHPELLRSAIGTMESLKEQARAITSIKVDAGTFAGPTFQYKALI